MRHDLNNESQETDRFSEKQTLDVFKGTDHPDLEKGVAAIGNVLKTLPLRPGVIGCMTVRETSFMSGKRVP